MIRAGRMPCEPRGNVWTPGVERYMAPCARNHYLRGAKSNTPPHADLDFPTPHPDFMSARPAFSLPRVRTVPLRTLFLFALQSDLDIAVPPRVVRLPGSTPGAFL